jgi:hypothetical protein
MNTKRFAIATLAALAVAAAGALARPVGATSPGQGGSIAFHRFANAGQASISRDPLLGAWDSGPVAMSRIKATIMRSGYTAKEVNAFLRDELGLGAAKSYEISLTFYRDAGRPYVVQRGWDPTKGHEPSDGDHGPYTRLRNRRVAFTSADPSVNHQRMLYRYRITGRSLALTVLKVTDPTRSAAELRLHDRLFMALTAALTYSRKG